MPHENATATLAQSQSRIVVEERHKCFSVTALGGRDGVNTVIVGLDHVLEETMRAIQYAKRGHDSIALVAPGWIKAALQGHLGSAREITGWPPGCVTCDCYKSVE
jgi:hypothetical protein